MSFIFSINAHLVLGPRCTCHTKGRIIPHIVNPRVLMSTERYLIRLNDQKKTESSIFRPPRWYILLSLGAVTFIRKLFIRYMICNLSDVKPSHRQLKYPQHSHWKYVRMLYILYMQVVPGQKLKKIKVLLFFSIEAYYIMFTGKYSRASI